MYIKKWNIDMLWVRIFFNFSEFNYRCLFIKKRDFEGKVLEMELGIYKFFSIDIFFLFKIIEIVIEFVWYL